MPSLKREGVNIVRNHSLQPLCYFCQIFWQTIPNIRRYRGLGIPVIADNKQFGNKTACEQSSCL
jgi:hypothetical protein